MWAPCSTDRARRLSRSRVGHPSPRPPSESRSPSGWICSSKAWQSPHSSFCLMEPRARGRAGVRLSPVPKPGTSTPASPPGGLRAPAESLASRPVSLSTLTGRSDVADLGGDCGPVGSHAAWGARRLQRRRSPGAQARGAGTPAAVVGRGGFCVFLSILLIFLPRTWSFQLYSE